MNRITIVHLAATLLLAISTVRSSAQHPADDRLLQEVVILGGKHKQRSITNRGARIPGTVSMLTPDKVGYEVGSALSIKHPFEAQEIEFDIIANSIKGVTLQIEIYRDSTFTAVLPQPILVDIPEGKKKTIAAVLTKRTLLEPGDYIIGVTFVSCDAETLQQWIHHEQWDAKTRYEMMKQNIEFPLYLKAGYIRSSTTDAFERYTANIGLRIKGSRQKELLTCTLLQQ